MVMIAPAPQTDALADALLDEPRVSDATLQIVQRVRDLEREVTILRSLLAARPAHAGGEQEWRNEIAGLLSRVALFRIALAEGKQDPPRDGGGITLT